MVSARKLLGEGLINCKDNTSNLSHHQSASLPKDICCGRGSNKDDNDIIVFKNKVNCYHLICTQHSISPRDESFI